MARSALTSPDYGAAFTGTLQALTPLVQLIEGQRNQEQQWRMGMLQSDIARVDSQTKERIANNSQMLDRMRLDAEARRQEWQQFIEGQEHLMRLRVENRAAEELAIKQRREEEKYQLQKQQQAAVPGVMKSYYSAQFTASQGAPLRALSQAQELFSSEGFSLLDKMDQQRLFAEFKGLSNIVDVSQRMGELRAASSLPDRLLAWTNLARVAPELKEDPTLQVFALGSRKDVPQIAAAMALVDRVPGEEAQRKAFRDAADYEAFADKVENRAKALGKELTLEEATKVQQYRAHAFNLRDSALGGAMALQIGSKQFKGPAQISMDPQTLWERYAYQLDITGIRAKPKTEEQARVIRDFFEHMPNDIQLVQNFSARLGGLDLDKLDADSRAHKVDMNDLAEAYDALTGGGQPGSDVLQAMKRLGAVTELLHDSTVTPMAFVSQAAIEHVARVGAKLTYEEVQKLAKAAKDPWDPNHEVAVKAAEFVVRANPNAASMSNKDLISKAQSAMRLLINTTQTQDNVVAGLKPGEVLTAVSPLQVAALPFIGVGVRGLVTMRYLTSRQQTVRKFKGSAGSSLGNYIEALRANGALLRLSLAQKDSETAMALRGTLSAGVKQLNDYLKTLGLEGGIAPVFTESDFIPPTYAYWRQTDSDVMSSLATVDSLSGKSFFAEIPEPVLRAAAEPISRDDAMRALGMDPSKRYETKEVVSPVK